MSYKISVRPKIRL